MLNELLVVERGARLAGIGMPERHPDVKDVGRMATLLVQLDAKGEVSSVQPVAREVKAWTLRDGQHNSFPFVKSEVPLWAIPKDEKLLEDATDRKSERSVRRSALLALAADADFNAKELAGWPGTALLNRLRERRRELASLDDTDAAVVPATIDRFLLACDTSGDRGPQRLLRATIEHLVRGLRQSAQDHWLEVARAILVGKFDKKRNCWVCDGALLFEASGYGVSMVHPMTVVRVSEALRVAGNSSKDAKDTGICSLTGVKATLLTGNFPQPNLPVLGQTYLFSKNRDIPANDRYRHFVMVVSEDAAMRIDAALRALTSKERDGVTWRAIPGEGSKQSDLLLAFVAEAPEAAAASALAEEGYFSLEATPAAGAAGSDSIAAFEKRAARLVDAVRAKVGADFRKTPVQLAVLRKVDPANRKVVYAGTASVSELYDAASGWVAGERNVPPWLSLLVLRKGERIPTRMTPPHLAPLGVISFSKSLFLRGGTERQEVTGLPASEALGLFLEAAAHGSPGRRRVARVLRMVLGRRAAVVWGTAHALRSGTELERDFRYEALRTVSMLGVLLHKVGRTKEGYMSDAAFKLGQLLAAADAVHAGYCADVRGGAVPPSLLGNQVFAMAQTAPSKALATLCRRWKPYDGWAKKAAQERDQSGKLRADRLVESVKKEDQGRGWKIRMALRDAREVRAIADELGRSLPDCVVDDVFRAELLLGYIAGLPKPQREEGPDNAGRGD
jgi:hypothetical protein